MAVRASDRWHRILVVDDEERIRTLVDRVLDAAGFEVDTAATGHEALAAASAADYGLVVLDLMLPDLNGMVVLRRLLDRSPTLGVLVLSAVPEIGQRVRALDLGARDFLAKPFANDELVARVRARLRPRPEPSPADPPPGEDDRVALDAERQELRVGPRRIELSQREFRLFSHLVRHAGQVCSREDLLAEVWGYRFDPGTNVVDVYVRRLRAKLSPVTLIRTVRNVGYSFITD